MSTAYSHYRWGVFVTASFTPHHQNTVWTMIFKPTSSNFLATVAKAGPFYPTHLNKYQGFRVVYGVLTLFPSHIRACVQTVQSSHPNVITVHRENSHTLWMTLYR